MTTASEALHEFQRQRIEGAWEVPVLDNYGLKEHNVFIAQCRRGRYHIFPEYRICEILGPTMAMPSSQVKKDWTVDIIQ